MMPYIRKDRRELEEMNKFISIGNGVFKYYWVYSNEDMKVGLFWIVFFDCVDFWIRTGNNTSNIAQMKTHKPKGFVCV